MRLLARLIGLVMMAIFVACFPIIAIIAFVEEHGDLKKAWAFFRFLYVENWEDYVMFP